MEALCKGTLFQQLSAFPGLYNMKEDCLFEPTTLETSWSLLGPGVEVGLTPSFMD